MFWGIKVIKVSNRKYKPSWKVFNFWLNWMSVLMILWSNCSEKHICSSQGLQMCLVLISKYQKIARSVSPHLTTGHWCPAALGVPMGLSPLCHPPSTPQWRAQGWLWHLTHIHTQTKTVIISLHHPSLQLYKNKFKKDWFFFLPLFAFFCSSLLQLFFSWAEIVCKKQSNVFVCFFILP